jgi:aminopeptidase YwaD
MILTDLTSQAEKYLKNLCVDIPRRSVGSPGNREATTFFADRLASHGFQTECPPFDCIYWTQAGAHLTAGEASFQIFVSPYSLGCQVQEAPLVTVSSLDELEAVQAVGKLLLVRGALAGEQLMPKNFPFYNPEEHQRITHLLETKSPLAIIAATTRNPELAGALYPFPLIEDGDFDIPSVYLTEEEGDRLLQFAGQPLSLTSASRRIPATGCNVIARKNRDAKQRAVLTAHIDAKESTPGAVDNAAGVVTLLLLAELLHDYSGKLGIELVAINGEDYYAAPGEIQYLQLNQGRLGDILLNINLDGVGYIHGLTAYSLYECLEPVSGLVRRVFSAYPGLAEGERWYQSDHMVFVQSGVPALAITTDRFIEMETHIAHTAQDTPQMVDPARLACLALALRDLLLALDGSLE